MPLRQFLPQHEVATAYERGWATLKNGELLGTAEVAGFAMLITTDTNLKYQQNLSTRHIAVVVLSTTSWPRIRASADLIINAIDHTVTGNYKEIRIP